MKTPLWVRFFLFLAYSKGYNNFKESVRDLFINPQNFNKRVIDYTLIFFVVSSVAVFVYEVKFSIPSWLEFYAVYFTSAVFAVEYLINLWLARDIRFDILKEHNEVKFLKRQGNYGKVFLSALGKNLRYMFTITAIIDLLAIFPMYRPLRMLRIFVLFRFLKILKHVHSLHQFLEVIYNRRFELLMLFVLFLFVVFVGAIAIYITEESINSKINSLLDALYWSYITITTVGYGDITPLSAGGKVISFIIVLLGLIIISFGTSVIVTAFMEKLHAIKEESMANHLLAHDDYYIVCGYGQLTKVLAASLAQEGKEFLILDNSEKNVKNAIDDGYSAILDDPARYDVLKRFYTAGSNIIVLALTGSDIENIYISINAKSISKGIFVVARASRKEMREKYIRAGADRVLLPNDLAAFMMEASVVKPVMYKAINALLNFKEIASLDELYIDKDSDIVNLPLEEAKFNLYRIVVLGIQRGLEGEFIFNPPDDYILKAGDIVIVTSHSRYIEHFKLTHNLKRNIWSQ